MKKLLPTQKSISFGFLLDFFRHSFLHVWIGHKSDYSSRRSAEIRHVYNTTGCRPQYHSGPKWGIHDKPDIGFDATDFYVGFIRYENIPLFVGILVDKGFNADGGSLAIVGNLLM